MEFARQDPSGAIARWCNGPDAYGELRFDALGDRAGDRIAFALDAVLSGCGSPAPEVPVRVQGSVVAMVPGSFEELCAP